MSDLKLGALIDGTVQRDAVHVAVAPVIAAEPLAPGDHIGFVQGEETAERVQRRLAGALGIVDPFLRTRVMPGDRFWMFLYPQTITSLRHDWTHPIFDAVSQPVLIDKEASERWLRGYADVASLSYAQLLDSTEDKIRGGDGINTHSDLANELFDKAKDFWRHYEIVTGKTLDADVDRESVPFYCAC